MNEKVLKTLEYNKIINMLKDEAGSELKEFGNTHIKDNMIFIPQIDAYIDLR